MATSKNAGNPSAYSRIHRLKSFDGIQADSVTEAAAESIAGLIEMYGESGPPTAPLMTMKIAVSAAESAEVAAERLAHAFSNWLLGQAPHASCHLVEVDTVLGYRYSLVRGFLAVEPPQMDTADGVIFASAKELISDVILGFSAYLDTLFTSLSPEVWGMSIGRPGGVIVLLYGGLIAGQDNLPADKIQLLGPSIHLARSERTDPGLEPKAYAKAAHWWVAKLNTMFSIATEPANYAPVGVYDEAMALEKLVTLEQVFRDCQSLATITRDNHARLSLSFQALGRFDGLISGFKWDSLFTHRTASGLLQTLRDRIPPEVHPVLLPRAERAVEALVKIRDGFFEARRASADGIQVPNKKTGQLEEISLEQATREWLTLYRNSLHGFDQSHRKPRDRALFAAHDGRIPGEIADLAWLQLLVLVSRPELLIRFSPPKK
ncbi:hypothetical protein QEH68_22235 (plasmid) [Paenarthrobacter sp. OM7]|uniref:hypothetical protein n=1 Tax=Paenarthrobacter sp. OM7 TaxID=3041264 RepID=UPI002469824B|nr:hypothetical protein [Paenarthrobacter sp. OM7]WGM22849.1 hypothetical protein QEH68_22235 [Paenarthrobacter sp. OM7]